MQKLIFGDLDNIENGNIFQDRAELSKSGIHGPTMAGIWGREKEGACSIVLSGGYEDDIDDFDYILYTDHGGQDPNTGKQIKNQEFLRGNKALTISHMYDLPVRVTRGYQVKFGPNSGYRYDGLYSVTQYERIKGKSGHLICRFHLKAITNNHQLKTKLNKIVTENIKRQRVDLSESLKSLYNYKCQVCNVLLKTSTLPIIKTIHIKPLGKPHNGPDTLDNLLCLCPNHYYQFQNYGFYIDPDNFKVMKLNNYKSKLIIHAKHNINKKYLEYFFNLYLKYNPNDY